MALLQSLPAPVRSHALPAPAAQASTSSAVVTLQKEPEVCADDFKDGGAFPEIHVAQYPLDMGRGDQQRSNKTLAVTVDGDGQVNYDSILRQGENRDKLAIHADHKALVPKIDKMTKEVGEAPCLRTIGEIAAPGVPFAVHGQDDCMASMMSWVQHACCMEPLHGTHNGACWP